MLAQHFTNTGAHRDFDPFYPVMDMRTQFSVGLIQVYRKHHPTLEYSDDAWNTLIDHATIHTGGTINIHFTDETAVAIH